MTKKSIEVDAVKHAEAKRKNIPTAEFETVMREEDKSPVRLAYERRNRDLDPQLVWRGKDEQDWSDLIVQAPPLYIQETRTSVALSGLLTKEETGVVPFDVRFALQRYGCVSMKTESA